MEFKECVCCGQKTLEIKSRYDICEVCGWEDDPIQNDDPDYVGGANSISLNMAKDAFLAGKALLPLKRADRDRYRTRIAAASLAAIANGEEFYEGDAAASLEDENEMVAEALAIV
jgi:hypothetical protein